ncbi:uncharacterized protein Tco025E_07105 [Trypanosoma conorhini]|uniref:Uncharacterized protein n=1 Tax=Trypanosoma conorhini TaxID=83891 RepID=A0A3R7KJ97_9TRYP|nr:uncharacterized protein Tco025E_07105 [Trypanosoma conorhini]RNF08662.1 hypothetical protein Tco025E_07105 [Trypanosoma conorhini]
MSLLKADQVRRELFATYSRQIAALLGEMVDGEPAGARAAEADDGGEEEAEPQPPSPSQEGDAAAALATRFRVSYARQHLLRQRALRLPGAHAAEAEAEDDTHRPASSEAGEATATSGGDVGAVTAPAVAAGDAAAEEAGWRLAYSEPYPSLRRIMRRVQDESLQTLLRESRVPVAACRDEAYAAQRISVLRQIEERIGRERATLLARQQKMDGKLHLIP